MTREPDWAAAWLKARRDPYIASVKQLQADNRRLNRRIDGLHGSLRGFAQLSPSLITD